MSEGNVVSQRFGNKYDTVKKYIRLFPDRPHGENWDARGSSKPAVYEADNNVDEDVDLATERLDRWICEHPKGILALIIHLNRGLFCNRTSLAGKLPCWHCSTFLLSANVSKPLQDMKEIDILSIAEKELNPGQIQILKAVLTNEQFDKELKQALAAGAVT